MAITTDQLEIKIALVAKDAKKGISEIKDSLKELSKAIDEKTKSEQSAASSSKKAAQEELLASTRRINAMKEEAAAAKMKNDLGKQASREAKIAADAMVAATNAEAAAMAAANRVAAEQEKTIRIAAAARKREQKEAEAAAKAVADSGGMISKAFSSVESTLRRSFAPLTALNQGAQLASMAFGQLVNAMKATLGPAVELQTAVAKINTLLTDTERQTFNAAKEIQKVQTLTGGSQADIAAGFYDVLASGAVEAGKATEFMSTAQKLAIGGMTTVAESVKVLRSVMAAYGIEASKVTEISDALFIAARDGATDVQQLSQEMGSSIGVASQLGVSYQELAAFASALTLTGVSTSEAFTSINSIMVAFARQTEEMSGRLKELGITSIQTEIATNGLVSTIRKVFGDSAASSEGIIALTGRVEGFKAVAAATSESIGKSFDKIMGNIISSAQAGGGATSKAFNEMSDTAEYQAKKTVSLVTAAFSILGEGASKALAESLKSINTAFTDLTPYIKGFADALGKIDFESLTKAIIATTVAVWAYNSALVKTMVTIAATATSTLTLAGGLSAMAAAAWAAVVPVAILAAKFLIVSGIILGVIELISLLVNNFDWMVDKLTGGFKGIEFEGGIISKTIASFSPAMDTFSESTDKAKDSLEEMKIKADEFRSSIRKVVDDITKVDWNMMWQAGQKMPTKDWSMMDKVDMNPPVTYDPETEKAYQKIKESIKGMREEVDRLTLSEEEATKSLFRRKQAEITAVERSLKLEKKLTTERQATIREARRLLFIQEREMLIDIREEAANAQRDLQISLAQIQGNSLRVLRLNYEKDLSQWKKSLEDKLITQDDFEKARGALILKLNSDIQQRMTEDVKEQAELRDMIVLRKSADLFSKLQKMNDDLQKSGGTILSSDKEEDIKSMEFDRQVGPRKFESLHYDPQKLTEPFRKAFEEIFNMGESSYSALKDLYNKGLIDPDRARYSMEKAFDTMSKAMSKIPTNFKSLYESAFDEMRGSIIRTTDSSLSWVNEKWKEFSKGFSREDFLKNYKKIIESFKKSMEGQVEISGPNMDQVDKIMEVYAVIPEIFGEYLDLSKEKFVNFQKQVAIEMDGTAIAIQKGVDKAGEYMEAGASGLANIIPVLIKDLIPADIMLKWFKEAQVEFTATISQWSDMAKKNTETWVKYVKGASDDAAGAFKPIQEQSNIFQKGWDTALKGLGYGFRGAVGVVGGITSQIGIGLVEGMKSIWYGLKGAITSALSNFNIWVMLFKYFNKDKAEFKAALWDILKSGWEVVDRFAENIPTFLMSIIGRLPETFLKTFTRLPEIYLNLFSSIIMGLNKLLTNADIFKSLGVTFATQVIRGLWDSLQIGSKTLLTSIMGMLVSIANGIITVLNKVFGVFGMNLSKIKFKAAKDVKEYTKDWYVTEKHAKDQENANKDEEKKKRDQEKPARFKAVGGSEFRVKDYQGALENVEANAFRLASDEFDNKTEVFAGAMKDVEDSFFSDMDGFLEGGLGSMKGWGKTLWDSFLNPVGNTFTRWGAQIWNGFLGEADPITFFTNLGKKIWEGMVTSIKDPLAWFSSLGAKIWEGMTTFVKDPLAYFMDLGRKIWEGIVTSVKDPLAYFLDFGKKIWEGMTTFVKDPIAYFLDFGKKIWEGMTTFVKDPLAYFLDFGKKIWEGMTTFAKDPLSYFQNFGKSIWSGLTSSVDSTGLFSGLGKKIWEGFKTSISGGLGDAFKVPPSAGKVEGWMGIDIPFIKFAEGGRVPGSAPVKGDSLVNDRIPALLSPGEFVLPRSVTMNPESMAVLQALMEGKPVMMLAGGGLLETAGAVLTGGATTLAKGAKGLSGTVKAVYDFLKKIGGDVSMTKMLTSPLEEATRAFKGVATGWLKPQMAGIMENVLKMADGGIVPGKASFPGDSSANDRILAMLSPGELVVPRTTVSDLMGASPGGQGGGMMQTVNIDIKVEAGANVDAASLRRELVPKVIEEIRKLSQNGAQVMSKRGVY